MPPIFGVSPMERVHKMTYKIICNLWEQIFGFSDICDDQGREKIRSVLLPFFGKHNKVVLGSS